MYLCISWLVATNSDVFKSSADHEKHIQYDTFGKVIFCYNLLRCGLLLASKNDVPDKSPTDQENHEQLQRMIGKKVIEL